MSKPDHRSQRFIQAATSERNRLARKRAQLAKKRGDLQGRIDDLDKELEAVDREIVVLEDFSLDRRGQVGRSAANSTDGEQKLLSGGAIRALAVPMLLRQRGPGPIHYVKWAQMLREGGFEIAGKRPDAVFLNQVVRSPLVRATTKAGFYELDLEAPQRLENRLRQQKTKLATLMIETPEGAEKFERHHEAQRELQTSIGRAERELAEAQVALKDAAAHQEEAQARAA